jgi:hypothetical protein
VSSWHCDAGAGEERAYKRCKMGFGCVWCVRSTPVALAKHCIYPSRALYYLSPDSSASRWPPYSADFKFDSPNESLWSYKLEKIRKPVFRIHTRVWLNDIELHSEELHDFIMGNNPKLKAMT